MRGTYASLLVTLALAGCAHGGDRRCAGSAADREAVGAAVRSYFAALAADDEAAAARLTSPSFYAYDAGQRFTGPELSAAVRKIHAAGVELNWNVGPVDVHFDCNSAWAAWENVGSAGKPPKLEPVTWLESAMLRRDGTRWRIEFLHSSRAEP